MQNVNSDDYDRLQVGHRPCLHDDDQHNRINNTRRRVSMSARTVDYGKFNENIHDESQYWSDVHRALSIDLNDLNGSVVVARVLTSMIQDDSNVNGRGPDESGYSEVIGVMGRSRGGCMVIKSDDDEDNPLPPTTPGIFQPIRISDRSCRASRSVLKSVKSLIAIYPNHEGKVRSTIIWSM